MNRSETYEILDLWMRSMTRGNSFIENDFWQKHYDTAKETYLTEKDNFVYIEDDKIVGFICVDSSNSIRGVFVDPEYENQGIGTALIEFVKERSPMLNMNIYMKNRRALDFASYHKFLIDGAVKDPLNNEIQYTMIWTE